MISVRAGLSLVAVLLNLPLALAQSPGPAAPQDPLHAWVQGNDPAALEAWVNERIDEEKSDAATLRDKAQALTAKISSAGTDLGLNQKVYAALAAIPLPTDAPPTRHYLERTLLEYRLAGVDKDEATRKQIRALQDKITDLALTFGRNVADGTLKITATRAELDGLPADYIARHKPNADGTYTLTTDQPDYRPVLSFASSDDLRRRIYLAYNTRAYPKNTQVLRDLLATRQRLATLLGYPHFADLNTADTMIVLPQTSRASSIRSTPSRDASLPASTLSYSPSRNKSNLASPP